MEKYIGFFGVDATGKSTLAKQVEETNLNLPVKHLYFEKSPQIKFYGIQLVICMYFVLKHNFSSPRALQLPDYEKKYQLNKQKLFQATNAFLDSETNAILKADKNSDIAVVEGALFPRAISTYFTLYPQANKNMFSQYEEVYKKRTILPLLLTVSEKKQLEILQKRRQQAADYEHLKEKIPGSHTLLDLMHMSDWLDFILLDNPNWRSNYTETYNAYIQRIFPDVTEKNVLENGDHLEIMTGLQDKLESLKNSKNRSN